MNVEERMEHLEKELSRANRRNRRLEAGAILCFGLAVTVWILRPQTLLAQPAANAMKEVRANRFVLEDERGTIRAGLVSSKDGPTLGLTDEKGTLRASLGESKINMPDGKTITYPESSLLLFGPDGKGLWHAP
jgi:hypothetical protein